MVNEAPSTFEQIRTSLSEFVSRETELAKAEIIPAAKHAGIGSGFFAGAGAFAFHALWMLIIAAALAIGWLLDSVTALSTWGSFTLGFVITAIFSLLVAFILIKLGQGQLRKVKAPEATIAEAKATLTAVMDAASGKQRADVELAAQNVIPVEAPRRSA